MPHPDLRAAVPESLAKWLDAHVMEGIEFGEPGYPGLRAAWAGSAPPAPELLDDFAIWLETWLQFQADSEQAYDKLVATEGFEPDRIPGWYFMPWAQVLLSMPWDEHLPEAIEAARAYVRDAEP